MVLDLWFEGILIEESGNKIWFCFVVVFSLLLIVLIMFDFVFVFWLVFFRILFLFFIFVMFFFIGGVKCELILILSNICEFLFSIFCFKVVVIFLELFSFLFILVCLLFVLVFGLDCFFG